MKWLFYAVRNVFIAIKGSWKQFVEYEKTMQALSKTIKERHYEKKQK